jgi:hypothetical protein
MISPDTKNNTLNHFKYLILSFSLLFFPLKHAVGQTVDRYDFERIEDNSFLIEEAYNQEPGVIQHISTFQLMKGNTWLYTFTDEWPVPGMRHQLSATIPLLNTDALGLGDIALNYRYQAIFKPRFAFSPRFSLILPTGNSKKGLGGGVIGYQLNLPVSFIVSRYVVTHYNAGITLAPNTSDESGLKSDQTVFNYGFSVIFLIRKNFNFMLEAVGNSTSIKSTNLANRNVSTMFVNPGMRYAINFKSGLQIVPGLSIPVGLGPSSGEYGIFGYLSFEHPFWKPKP